MHVASSLGIPFTRMAAYEWGRAKVPYGAAIALCRAANVRQRWLATGLGQKHPFNQMSYLEELETSEARTPFSEVYEAHLRTPMEKMVSFSQNRDRAALIKDIDFATHNLAHEGQEYFKAMASASQSLLKHFKKSPGGKPPGREGKSKKLA